MTTSDLTCDRCGATVVGPAGPGVPEAMSGVRFSYHPGDVALRDDAGLLCGGCWSSVAARFVHSSLSRCAVCGRPVGRYQALHLRRSDAPGGWLLCAPDAADLLNELTTVEPKLDRDRFRLPLEDREFPAPARESDDESAR